MRYFRQEARPEGPGYNELSNGGLARATDGYFELAVPLSRGGYGVCYLAGQGPTSLVALACLDDTFTGLVRTYMSVNEVIQAALVKTYRETWPLVYELLVRGMSEPYEGIALFVMPDPDDGVAKWFIGTLVEDLPSLRMDHALNERTTHAAATVLGTAERAVNEFRTWNIDMSRYATDIFKISVTADMKAAASFLAENFDTILDVLELVGSLEG